MAGIYIHIPFCKQKCSYCDFHFSTTYHSYRERMIRSLIKEIRERKDEISEPVRTIYFGGGTPGLLDSDELNAIISAIRENYAVDDNIELTLETNPDDYSDELKVRSWKEAGVNRLSIGIQSFREKDLKWMNRAHSVEESFQALDLARSLGIENITVDLIYGLPDMDLDEWEHQLDQFLELEIPHLSAYCLTVEQKTALNKMVEDRILSPANEEMQAEHFKLLVEKLSKAGYEQYEISNFSKSGWRSRHNSAYWSGEMYLGIGPSAHSFDGKQRRWNVANNQLYIKALENKEEYFDFEELTAKERFNEFLLTGLRRVEGVSLDELFKIASPGSDFNSNLEKFTQLGWIGPENPENQIQLTFEGKLRADYIASELFIV